MSKIIAIIALISCISACLWFLLDLYLEKSYRTYTSIFTFGIQKEDFFDCAKTLFITIIVIPGFCLSYIIDRLREILRNVCK